MTISPTPTRQTSPIAAALIDLELDLAPGDTLDFEVDGRRVTVRGTDSGVIVVSSAGHAVVIRPEPRGMFVVTGALRTHNPSEPVSREGSIRIALDRLTR
jgi:hypothetical protein